MARAFLPMFVCLLAVAVSAQNTPESALVELALAPDLKSASKHYPEALAEVLSALPPRDMAVAQQKLLPANLLGSMNVHPKVSEDGKAFLLLENSEKHEAPVELTHRISDGANAMLELQACDATAGLCLGRVQAWMRYEDGDWRLVELDRQWGSTRVKLDDPDFIESFRNAERNENEKKALEALQRIMVGVSVYANVFPDVGFPEKLDSLSQQENTLNADSSASDSNDDDSPPPPDPDHARLLPAEFAKNRFELNGYKIEYTLTRHGNAQTGAYTVTAVPVRFGETGIKSFFVNESGAFHVTREDRAATEFDRGTGPTFSRIR